MFVYKNKIHKVKNLKRNTFANNLNRGFVVINILNGISFIVHLYRLKKEKNGYTPDSVSELRAKKYIGRLRYEKTIIW